MSATATSTEAAAPVEPASEPGTAQGWFQARFGPWCIVTITCIWGLVELRPELTAVPYLDDSSLHQQMTRFASSRIKEGHLPLTSWFPYLGLGSPQFLHYQSLPAMTAGAIGAAANPDTVFRWSMYLLLALWPLAVYWGARLFGLGRWTAASAAAVAPFLSSWAGIGYETKAYVWAGYGVWTQLWASWTLPLAWGFTYRSLRSLRAIFPAVLFIMLTVALHFETGYLALVPLVVWPFVVPSDLRRRLLRAAAIGAAALVASAWVVYPVLAQSHWAARNQILSGGPLENGYGTKVLWWLISGQLYDFQRVVPVVTVLAGVGLIVCLARWRTFVAGRAIVTIWVVTLLMTLGRATWGFLYDIVPGSSDIFIRRFEMGVQLSGLLLAGVGIVAIGRFAVDQVARLLPENQRRWTENPTSHGLVAGLCIAALLIGLAPAWWNISTFDSHNRTNISLQAQSDALEGPQIDHLIDYVQAHPRGRVYAGSPTNWGADFTVGAVPVFKYLESKDVDEVGYTLRTASLMTDPEYFFDDTNPGDYPLFGVGYLLIPETMSPPVPASNVGCAGQYCLWSLPEAGYIHVYDTTGVLDATRANVGTQSESLLESQLPSEDRDLTVAFNGAKAASPTAADPSTLSGKPGHVVHQSADLANGQAHAVVSTTRRATVVLSASYDPGWKATVDGHPTPTVMVAPALVGVVVGPGVHTVSFSYAGFGSYNALFALTLIVLVGLAVGPWLWRRTRRRGISAESVEAAESEHVHGVH